MEANIEILYREPIFKIISEAAEELQVECYVIGGFVRDLILKRPCKDIDVVCVGSGIQLADLVANKLGKIPVNVFKNFGTAMLHSGDC